MAILLSLETSTHSFSCALHHDKKQISFKESIHQQTTASMLAMMIEEMVRDSGVKKSEISAVVVSSGPGSYTGLRIGVATAKGICFALNIPLIAVDTLSLITLQLRGQFKDEKDTSDALFCPMLDARRMEVYCMLADKNNRVIQPIQAKVITKLSFAEQLTHQVIYFFGEGSDKCKNLIHHFNAKFVEGIKPSAAFLGLVGFQKYLNNEVENMNLFEPLYLKDFLIKKPNLLS